MMISITTTLWGPLLRFSVTVPSHSAPVLRQPSPPHSLRLFSYRSQAIKELLFEVEREDRKKTLKDEPTDSDSDQRWTPDADATGVKQVVNTTLLHCDDKIISHPPQMGSKDMAMIGLDSMKRANSALEDFCRSYFMFHKLDPHEPQSLFRYLPVLSFTESCLYQLDYLNEKLTVPSAGKDRSPYREISLEAKQTSANIVNSDPFRPLCNVLEQHGLLTDRIREELKSGEEYWSLERKLCHQLGNKQEISLEDVMRANHLRSADYRVLNLLLYRLRGEEVDDMHMEFLSISEFLMEICDDLFDYKDDVLENTFNILRMFSRIYGASAAPAMLANLISKAEDKYHSLLKGLDPELSLNYQKRCEDVAKEGGKTSGPAPGTWNIPPVIEDEELYRSNVSNSDLSIMP